MFLPQCERKSFATIQKTGKIIVLCTKSPTGVITTEGLSKSPTGVLITEGLSKPPTRVITTEGLSKPHTGIITTEGHNKPFMKVIFTADTLSKTPTRVKLPERYTED